MLGDGMESAMPGPTLLLYSRTGCHLCDEMKTIVQPLAREFSCALEEVDISTDPALETRFGHDIPVLYINDRKAFKYRLTARELRRRLRDEAGRAARAS